MILGCNKAAQPSATSSHQTYYLPFLAKFLLFSFFSMFVEFQKNIQEFIVSARPNAEILSKDGFQLRRYDDKVNLNVLLS